MRIRFPELIFSVLILLVACNGGQQKDDHADHAEHAEDPDVIYICSMDPQVIQDRPGRCPICGMNLTPVERQEQQPPGVIELSEQQVLLGGIITDTIGMVGMSDQQINSGVLVTDPNTFSSVNARVEGWIEKLYVASTGDEVKKGQPLYRLCSPELYNTQRDLLRAIQRADTNSSGILDLDAIAKAARNKLLLYGLTNAQIDRLEREGQAKEAIDILSPASGTVAEIFKREGEFLMEGEDLMRLADYSSLWVEAQIYAYNAAERSKIGKAFITMPDGRTIESNVEFIAPQTSQGSQLYTIRMSIPNKELTYRPGNAVTVALSGKSTGSIAVPKSAVLYDGNGASVWVMTGERIYELRMIRTGGESGSFVEVLAGLEAGEQVVVEGAYLVSSEYMIRRGEGAHDHAM